MSEKKTEGQMQPLVYVIVLNYNGRAHLEYCLPSILASAYPNFRVLFVDNASADDSVAYVRAHYPHMELLQTGANLGWAGGNNAGIAYAKQHGAQYVVLANNDIRVHPQWIAGAVEAFGSQPRVGLVSGMVFGDVAPVPLEEYETACAQWRELAFWPAQEKLCGMALFVDMRLFDQIGTIDETYFAYAEETDFGIRAEAAGYARLRTNVPIWHYSSGTFSRYRLRASYLAIRNTMRLAIKHYPLVRLLKTILNIFYIGCWPLYKGDMRNVTISRLRPRNVLLNLGLDLYCLGWNLWHLPATLRRRREDYRLIRLAREEGGRVKAEG